MEIILAEMLLLNEVTADLKDVSTNLYNKYTERYFILQEEFKELEKQANETLALTNTLL